MNIPFVSYGGDFRMWTGKGWLYLYPIQYRAIREWHLKWKRRRWGKTCWVLDE